MLFQNTLEKLAGNKIDVVRSFYYAHLPPATKLWTVPEQILRSTSPVLHSSFSLCRLLLVYFPLSRGSAARSRRRWKWTAPTPSSEEGPPLPPPPPPAATSDGSSTPHRPPWTVRNIHRGGIVDDGTPNDFRIHTNVNTYPHWFMYMRSTNNGRSEASAPLRAQGRGGFVAPAAKWRYFWRHERSFYGWGLPVDFLGVAHRTRSTFTHLPCTIHH